MGHRFEGLLHIHKGNVERAEVILMVFDNRLHEPYRGGNSVPRPESLLAETERKMYLHPLCHDPMEHLTTISDITMGRNSLGAPARDTLGSSTALPPLKILGR